MTDEHQTTDDYASGYAAGVDNLGVWGGESAEWLRGFRDGADDRIESEQAMTETTTYPCETYAATEIPQDRKPLP